jgi:hypothetical protein
MKVKREYGIGEGKILKSSAVSLPREIPLPNLNIVKAAATPKTTFSEVTTRKSAATDGKSSDSQPSLSADANSSSSEDEEETPKLFPCPSDGCIKSFQRFSSLQHHPDVGNHKYRKLPNISPGLI